MTSPPQHQLPPEQQTAPPPEPSARKPPIILVETAFLASATSLVWLLSYYFPIGSFFKVFFPVPIALIYLRWGARAGWMCAAVAALLLSVLMGPTRSILFLMPYGLLGVQLGACWRRRVPWLTSIGLGAALDCVGVFFRLWLTSVLLGEDLWIYITVRIHDFIEWAFVQVGILAEPSLLLIQVMAIGLILLSNIVYIFVVHLVALLMFERLGNPIPKAPNWVETLMDL